MPHLNSFLTCFKFVMYILLILQLVQKLLHNTRVQHNWKEYLRVVISSSSNKKCIFPWPGCSPITTKFWIPDTISALLCCFYCGFSYHSLTQWGALCSGWTQHTHSASRMLRIKIAPGHNERSHLVRMDLMARHIPPYSPNLSHIPRDETATCNTKLAAILAQTTIRCDGNPSPDHATGKHQQMISFKLWSAFYLGYLTMRTFLPTIQGNFRNLIDAEWWDPPTKKWNGPSQIKINLLQVGV